MNRVAIFDGAGTAWPGVLSDPAHSTHPLFEQVRDVVSGACGFCAHAFDAEEGARHAHVKLLDDYQGHPSVRGSRRVRLPGHYVLVECQMERSEVPELDRTDRDGGVVEAPVQEHTERLSAWRIGITSGVVGIVCCVGPTVLALLGIVSAGTAFVWATDLYDNYAWWFRLAGLAVLVVLVWVALRRRGQCNVAGIRRLRWRLLSVLGIAVATYAALYATTTWLGTFA